MIKYVFSSLLLIVASNCFAANSSVHPVIKGDTLYGISARYHVRIDQLVALNNLRGKEIQIGQKLKIPSASSKLATVKKTQKTKEKLVKSASSKTNKVVHKSTPRILQLESNSAIVVDAETGQTLFSKNASEVKSIASITKLMTAMVALDANPSMVEMISIEEADIDYLKHTTSRMPIGTKLTRYEMMRLALMSSENRAAHSLSRNYPGGQEEFIAAMNRKALDLGMTHTHFSDPTGLTPDNVSTAEDLVKMVTAASQYELIRQFSTTPGLEIAFNSRGAPLQYKNSNRLVQKGEWDIKVSKTGYINEAGRCLVMAANVAHRPAIMVFLKSQGKFSPVEDAKRIKKWMEAGKAPVSNTVAAR